MCETFIRSFIALLNEGRENDAYRLLYKEYHALLLRFATAFLKQKEPAEELVNDLLYRIWLRKEGISEIANLKVYLMASVRNRCLTIIARSKTQQEKIAKISSHPETFADDPESLLISTELQTVIARTINDLPPRCKLIYELVRVERLRNKDVALRLNISVNTIDVQLAIALKRLVLAVNAFNQKPSSRKV